jgi:ATP-dependent helicase HrpB
VLFDGGEAAARVCALLSEDIRNIGSGDALTLADSPRLDRAAAELAQVYRRVGPDRAPGDLRRALLAGFPDRVAIRREPGSLRLLLAGGTGAVLAKESGMHTGEFVVALDVAGGQEALVRIASLVEREWLVPTREDVVHTLTGDRVRATKRLWYDHLLLREIHVPNDPAEERRLLAGHLRTQISPELQRRLIFARLDVDWDAVIETTGTLELPWDVRRKLDQLAPERLPLPSGRTARLDYQDDGSVVVSAKLQELFGLAESPRLGPDRTPVTFALLSPAGRPVQVTRDLRSFWNSGYLEVRKELRGRYPRHPWPDDPWTAEATHRTRRR